MGIRGRGACEGGQGWAPTWAPTWPRSTLFQDRNNFPPYSETFSLRVLLAWASPGGASAQSCAY
eukprot:scaffold5034_cov385-Prasinococcus_capsulatus_cf.AAC.4